MEAAGAGRYSEVQSRVSRLEAFGAAHVASIAARLDRLRNSAHPDRPDAACYRRFERVIGEGHSVMQPVPGAAGDIGFCPRRKNSITRMWPPQQEHGSRKVSGAGSDGLFAFGSGGCRPSRSRIRAILAFRVALASRP